MKREGHTNPTRRDVLATGSVAAAAAFGVPKLSHAAPAPASPVSIVRCRAYKDFGSSLATACDQIGGIDKLVRGKTVALKLNLTGNPKNNDLAIIDGVETVRGAEGPWLPGIEKMTPEVLLVGRNVVCTDSVGMAVMSYNPYADRGTAPFVRGENSLKLAEAVGVGTTDLNRIEVVGMSINDARINFGPGPVCKKLSELKA